jgi:hypothetical protein
MTTPRRVANPFALMTDPQSILDAVGRSGRLDQLKRRVCRPLDGPSPNADDDEAAGSSRADADVDGVDDTPRKG